MNLQNLRHSKVCSDLLIDGTTYTSGMKNQRYRIAKLLIHLKLKALKGSALLNLVKTSTGQKDTQRNWNQRPYNANLHLVNRNPALKNNNNTNCFKSNRNFHFSTCVPFAQLEQSNQPPVKTQVSSHHYQTLSPSTY